MRRNLIWLIRSKILLGRCHLWEEKSVCQIKLVLIANGNKINVKKLKMHWGTNFASTVVYELDDWPSKFLMKAKCASFWQLTTKYPLTLYLLVILLVWNWELEYSKNTVLTQEIYITSHNQKNTCSSCNKSASYCSPDFQLSPQLSFHQEQSREI